MSDSFQLIVQQLDLERAIRQGALSNDLLPSRPDDSVGGALVKGFSASLKSALARGHYRPDRASFIAVPKGNFTTRPAALMSLADRVVYEALVESLREKIERALLSTRVVMSPRGTKTKPRWREFESAPLLEGVSHVVKGDIAGFYESIPHDNLRDILIRTTGRTNEVEALIEFLSIVMSAPRGLPQGLEASDPLATVFLSQVDSEMVRQNIRYFRHGDDIRIGSRNFREARHALFTLEASVRRCGLHLNGAKSTIVCRANYEKEVSSVEIAMERTREQLLETISDRLRTNDAELTQAIKDADRDDLGWNFFFYRSIDLDTVIAELRPQLKPADIAIAEHLFEQTINRAPGRRRPLSHGLFHRRVAVSLTRLTAAKSLAVLPSIPLLISSFPDKWHAIFRYLESIKTAAPLEIARSIEAVIHSQGFRTDWEKIWQLRVLAAHAEHVSKRTARLLKRWAMDEQVSWIVRVEAMMVLAVRGELDSELPYQAWLIAPAPYRAEIIDAVASVTPQSDWTEAFLLAVSREDPICSVVSERTRAKRASLIFRRESNQLSNEAGSIDDRGLLATEENENKDQECQNGFDENDL